MQSGIVVSNNKRNGGRRLRGLIFQLPTMNRALNVMFPHLPLPLFPHLLTSLPVCPPQNNTCKKSSIIKYGVVLNSLLPINCLLLGAFHSTHLFYLDFAKLSILLSYPFCFFVFLSFFSATWILPSLSFKKLALKVSHNLLVLWFPKFYSNFIYIPRKKGCCFFSGISLESKIKSIFIK